MKKAFFSISGFSCGYDSFRLKDVSFCVEKGAFSGIIGPNGSGKTTLFRGITQILPTLEGSIQLSGIELNKMPSRTRAKNIAIVSQFEQAGQIRVRDYILLGRIPYYGRFQFFESKEDLEIAERYMKLTGLTELKDKWMFELSGGEQQRAAVARALTQEPKLLLLDEPTAHLDIKNQVKILDLLRKLNREMQLTVLMVIHDLNLASEYCDQLILLKDGKVFKKGSPEEVVYFETIEQVYETPVITRTNPYSGKPVVFLISESMLDSKS